MAARKSPSSFNFILKTIAIAAITYFWLYIGTSSDNPHNRHRDQNTVTEYKNNQTKDAISKQVLNSDLENMAQQIENEVHRSADLLDTESFRNICSQYKDICRITNFESSAFSSKQRLYYQVMVIYALKKIDDMGMPVTDYVDSINIRYKSAKSRGYSSRNQIILDTKAMNGYSEFLQVLVHELGHITDFRYLVGTESNPKDTSYTEFGKKTFPIDDPSLDFYSLSRINENTRNRSASYKDFVSGYGMSDIFEDFAETMNFYLNYRTLFQQLSKQSDILLAKYSFVDSLFWGQFINNGLKKKSQFEQYNRDFRPYDTTRF